MAIESVLIIPKRGAVIANEIELIIMLMVTVKIPKAVFCVILN